MREPIAPSDSQWDHWPPVGSESLLRMKHSQFLQLAPITGNINTLSFWSLPLDLPTLSLDSEFVEGKKSF